MTSALQEQLLTITQEMNKLKSELYSEQGGLAEKLNSLTERAMQVEASRSDSSAAEDSGRCIGDGASGGTSGGSASMCHNRCNSGSSAGASRGALPSSLRSGGGSGDERRQAARHVDWAPNTRHPTRQNRREIVRDACARGYHQSLLLLLCCLVSWAHFQRTAAAALTLGRPSRTTVGRRTLLASRYSPSAH